MVAELAVLVITWTQTFSQIRNARRVGIEASVSSILLRDGTSEVTRWSPLETDICTQEVFISCRTVSTWLTAAAEPHSIRGLLILNLGQLFVNTPVSE